MVIAMLKLRRFCFGRFQCQLSRSDLLFKFCLFGFQAGKFLFFRKHGSLSTPQRASQNLWYAFAITLYGCCLALPPCDTTRPPRTHSSQRHGRPCTSLRDRVARGIALISSLAKPRDRLACIL